jgi:nicotinic acid phosphoribosyltransferase
LLVIADLKSKEKQKKYLKPKIKKNCPMKNLIQIFFLCPISEEQKPIQQYIDWKQKKDFFSPISWIIWKELESKFLTSYFLYEEASWFDTQIWEKPLLIIRNDRLIQSQNPFFLTLFVF